MWNLKKALSVACALIFIALGANAYADDPLPTAADSPQTLEEMIKLKGAASASRLKNVTYTGKQKRNKRVEVPGKDSVVLVTGKISGIKKDGIYMDGEFFSTLFAEIVGTTGRKLTLKDLHYNLTANIRIEYGTVKMVRITGLKRYQNVTDPEKVKLERERRKQDMLERAKAIEKAKDRREGR